MCCSLANTGQTDHQNMSSDSPATSSGDIALTVSPAMDRNDDASNKPAANKDGNKNSKDRRNAPPPGGPEEPAYDDIAYAWAHASELEHKPLQKSGAFSSSSADLKVDGGNSSGEAKDSPAAGAASPESAPPVL